MFMFNCRIENRTFLFLPFLNGFSMYPLTGYASYLKKKVVMVYSDDNFSFKFVENKSKTKSLLLKTAIHL